MLLASLFDLSYITVVYVTHARSRKCINSEQTNNFRHRLSSTLKTHKVRFNQLLLKANSRNGIDFFFYMDFLTECSMMILHQMMAIICFRKKISINHKKLVCSGWLLCIVLRTNKQLLAAHFFLCQDHQNMVSMDFFYTCHVIFFKALTDN